MVSTRQMSTSSGAMEESNYLRPVVTRQSCTTANTAAVPSISSTAVAASSVGITTTNTTTSSPSTSGRQTQAFKSYTNTSTGSNVTQGRHHGMHNASGDGGGDINLLDLPEEVLYSILSYVGFKKIGQLRVVSHKMNDVCMHMLNSTFSKLITKTYNRFQGIKANMPRRESARRNHPLACECDIIETCYMRLSLLQMTFGKHIERGHCCFFPGAILDEVYTILNYIKNTPCLERPYRVTDELFDLSTMAMEYFRDRIEPTLPGIAYFNKEFFKLPTTTKRPLVIASDLSDNSTSLPSPPQSNMVLRKGIRKIKQGMKIYNNQLSVLRTELRTCKRKSAEQGKQIAEQQKLMAEQRKQTLEYATRLDENDKKNEEMARKFSTLLQELNKCKTELQYWRSKSPAIPTCVSCGQKVTPVLPPEDYQALINQGVKPEDIILNLNDDTDAESDVSLNDSGCNNNLSLSNEFVFPDETTTAKLLAANTASKNLKRQYHQMANHNNTTKVNQETELTEFIDCNEASTSSSAFIAAPGYSTRLFYGSNASPVTIPPSSTSNNGSLQHPLAQHKSVIVSPQSQRLVGMDNAKALDNGAGINVVTANASGDINAFVSGGGGGGGISNGSPVADNRSVSDDTSSLVAITSHETKKARRVQKPARCLNGTSGKRK
ncbi:F-box protein dampened [Haematobia irritans]|uniref:F-box protein dampened n=1 Tax=Haematobia irritans TaxID=7368 RepID=UPI003F501A02